MMRSLGPSAVCSGCRRTQSRITVTTHLRLFSAMSTSNLQYAREKQVAIAAVRRACTLTSSVFNKLVKSETATKGDKSPVTVADYSSQALVNAILARAFPDDPIVGEEDASDLRNNADPNAVTQRERIVQLATEALRQEPSSERGEEAAWGLGSEFSYTPNDILDAIDRGSHPGGRHGRMWTLDPIDGTKGFLRGGQYAVCLALIVDAQVQLGVIGCPNLPFDPTKPEGERGCVFVAVRGQGAHQLSISNPSALPLPLAIAPASTPSSLTFLESLEAAHSSHAINERIARLLGVTNPPARMDSQAKYACLARSGTFGTSEGNVYLRMPTGVGYREKIWDHASGNILITESGGVVTDSRGLPLDFGLGVDLGENFGVVAAAGEEEEGTHARVLKAVQEALRAEKEEKEKGGESKI